MVSKIKRALLYQMQTDNLVWTCVCQQLSSSSSLKHKMHQNDHNITPRPNILPAGFSYTPAVGVNCHQFSSASQPLLGFFKTQNARTKRNSLLLLNTYLLCLQAENTKTICWKLKNEGKSWSSHPHTNSVWALTLAHLQWGLFFV